uniref:Protein kinase domain-containing protein n=2 Tax=Rhodosorus marinus TaxID=101924 RepID=A0A7S0G2V6_9RHOD
MTVEKPINLSQLNELLYRINTVCRAAGIQEDMDAVETDLLNCDLGYVLSSMSRQLRRVEKKNRFNAIKMQYTWYGEGSKIPDKQLFDNVSVHLRTKFNEFKPAKGLTAVLTSAGGLYNNSPMQRRWEVLEEIGRGSSGVVYRARSKVLPGEYAAVKYIDKNSADYSETKVCREVYCFHIIQRAGGHENIVEVYEVDEDDQFVYIVMELLEGEELLNRVSMAGSYMENHSAAIVSQIVEALAFVHSLNIIHRDVKAENFVFSTPARNSPIKLIDFGVSFYSHDYGSCHGTELIGSALYLAPEMWARRTYNQAVDMFSLGILVHILLTGSPPFNCMDLHDYVHRIQDEDISLDGNEWASISPLGKQFVRDISQRDPEIRMTSREALEHAWLRAFDSAPEQSSHLGSVQKTLREFSVQCSVKKGRGFLPPLSSAAEAQKAIGALKVETKKPAVPGGRRTTFVDDAKDLNDSPYMPDTPESGHVPPSDPSTAPADDLRFNLRKADDEEEQSGGETEAAAKSSGGPHSGYISSRSSVPLTSSNGDGSSTGGSYPSSQKDSNHDRSQGSFRGGSFRRRRDKSAASEASGRSGDVLDRKKSSRLGELRLSIRNAGEGSSEPVSPLMLGKESGTDDSPPETNRNTPLSSLARFFWRPWGSKSSQSSAPSGT